MLCLWYVVLLAVQQITHRDYKDYFNLIHLFSPDGKIEIGRKHSSRNLAHWNISKTLTVLLLIESSMTLKCLLCSGLTADCHTVHETKRGANQPQPPLLFLSSTQQLLYADSEPICLCCKHTPACMCAHRYRPQTKDLGLRLKEDL